MAERKLIIDHLKFKYEGLFNLTELYEIISGWFFEKGWDWYEKINEEQVTSTGKQIRLVLEPWKSISDYHKLAVRIKVNFTDIKEVEVEHRGKKLRLNQGEIRMIFDGYVVSDRKNKWSEKPFYWFLSIIIEKYLLRSPLTRTEKWLKSDVDDLYNKIKDYLNVFKYTYHS